MRIIDGEKYFDVKNLAEIWGYHRPESLKVMLWRLENKGLPYPEPDIRGSRGGQPHLYRVSRLGELNEWHKQHLKEHPPRWGARLHARRE